jgi:hypothetical protein
MSLIRSLRRCGLAAALLCLAALAAAPDAPANWTHDVAGDVDIYRRVEGASFIEMRLDPAQASPGDIQAWFASRVAAPIRGIASSRFQPPSEQKTPALSVLLATGDGTDDKGRPVYLIRLGCRPSQGGARHAASIASPDDRFLQANLAAMITVFARACMDGPRTADTSRSAQVRPGTGDAAPRPAADAPYPYVKAAGTGVKAAAVEAVLWRWENEQRGMGMQVVDYLYLLLKDGSYRDGLPPVAFEDFDAAASRAGEPDKWGRWTRSGGDYLLAPVKGSDRTLRIESSSARLPARRDERLEGIWEGSSAYATLWSVAQSHWSVQFDKAGRFVKSSNSSIVGGAGSPAAGTAVHGAVNRDDDGSSSTVGGANFGGGSSRRGPNTMADRSGSYRLDGYTLELRYDNGRVVRLPFCATPTRDAIWFEGYELDRPKPGKR